MTTIELLVTTGSGRVRTVDDGRTLQTADRAPARHWEDTVAITSGASLVVVD